MTMVLDRPAISQQLAIETGQEHITHGLPRDAHLCPIALSLRAQGLQAIVSTAGVFLFQPSPAVHYEPTPEFVTWIKNFDNGWPVAPTRFVLERCGGCSISTCRR